MYTCVHIHIHTYTHTHIHDDDDDDDDDDDECTHMCVLIVREVVCVSYKKAPG